MNQKFIKLWKNKLFVAIFLSILIFLFVVFTIKTWFFYSIDKSIQSNLYLKPVIILNDNNEKVTKNLVVLKIDEKTIKALWRFPFKRTVYPKLIENLNNLWASIIAFDIIFADRTDKNIDKRFAESIKKAWNIVLWTAILNWNLIEKPLYIFEKNVLNYWYFQPVVDRRTNVVYDFVPKAKFRNWEYNVFGISILKSYYSKIFKDNSYLDDTWKYTKNYFVLKDIKIPLERKNSHRILINFLNSNSYKSYSFIDLYDKNSELYKKLKQSNWLKDKIILIWATAKGIKDIFLTPIWIKYWVYIHADILNTILTKNFLIYFDKNLEILILFLLIILSVYINITRNWKTLIFWNISVVVIFVFIFPTLVSINKIFLNYYAELLFALILSLILSNIYKYLIENRNKKVLVKALSEYISEDIAKKILSTTWEVKLDWDNKKISIFFSDIAWFTSISERMTPFELVQFLREYLGAMSDIIMDEKWFINKYEWDAIMALFWVFGYEKTSSYDNCKAALLQQTKLKVLNKEWKNKFWEELKVRMWIHTWEAIIWNIWSKWRKMEFTALWDAVNLASRLEWVNKFYGTYICVSEDVVKEVWDKFEFRKLDKIRVKWKQKPIIIYELLWFKDKISDLQKNIRKKFEEALGFYFDKNFKEALEIFKEISKIWDSPSKVFEKRCEDILSWKMEISDSWDWVWTMKEK